MTKKSLAFVLTFFLVFSPIYSYAVLPALIAAAASAGGRVLVGNAIKRVSQTALSKGGMAGIAAGLGALAATKSAIEQDGWTIDYGTGGSGAGGDWDSPGKGVDSDGNINIEIYKNLTCVGKEVAPIYRDDTSRDDPAPISVAFSALQQSAVSHAKNRTEPDYTVQSKGNFDMSIFNAAVDEHKKYVSSINAENFSVGTIVWRGSVSVPSDFYWVERQSTFRQLSEVGFGYKIVDCISGDKTYITNNEFNAYLTKNITVNDAGDLIKNIYNYDYSQHPNIKINNNDFGGNSLNNDLSVNVDPDVRVSPRLRVDIENKKVNLDNVNDTNCTKNDAGEYDKCDGSEEDPEEEIDPDEPTPEEPQPIECDANGFYKKICDWMDWTKKSPSDVTATPIDVKNVEAENSNKINMSGECPAPYDLNFTILGYTQNNSISYEPLCGALEMLKPIFIGSGALSSMFILMGYSRPSGTGVNDG